MKRYLLSVILSVVAFVVFAQDDYKPMLVEGRTWLAVDFQQNKRCVMDCSVEGDSIIDGVVWKKIHSVIRGYVNVEDDYLAREQDKKVISRRLLNGEYVETVIMDFNLTEGTNYKFQETSTSISESIFTVNGKNYRRLIVYNPLKHTDIYDMWVEGIGKWTDTIEIDGEIFTFQLISCYDNGVSIFKQRDFMTMWPLE